MDQEKFKKFQAEQSQKKIDEMIEWALRSTEDLPIAEVRAELKRRGIAVESAMQKIMQALDKRRAKDAAQGKDKGMPGAAKALSSEAVLVSDLMFALDKFREATRIPVPGYDPMDAARHMKNYELNKAADAFLGHLASTVKSAQEYRKKSQ